MRHYLWIVEKCCQEFCGGYREKWDLRKMNPGKYGGLCTGSYARALKRENDKVSNARFWTKADTGPPFVTA